MSDTELLPKSKAQPELVRRVADTVAWQMLGNRVHPLGRQAHLLFS